VPGTEARLWLGLLVLVLVVGHVGLSVVELLRNERVGCYRVITWVVRRRRHAVPVPDVGARATGPLVQSSRKPGRGRNTDDSW
jgi:hypothetical protein